MGKAAISTGLISGRSTPERNASDRYRAVARNNLFHQPTHGFQSERQRDHVEALARAKRTTYRQTLDERMGTQAFNQMRPHHSLAYPFTVLEDKNPKGRAWLLSVLAQAQRA